MRSDTEYYRSVVLSAIETLNTTYKNVYQILLPFHIKPSAKTQVYNPKLEEQWFEYNVTNLVLKHFGSMKGISDEFNVSEDQILKEIISNDFVEKDFSTLFHFTVNGESIERKKHAIFYQEYQKLADDYFNKERESDRHKDNFFLNRSEWKPMTWKSLCDIFDISYDKILFSDIWEWFEKNGYPNNIEFPGDWMDPKKKTIIVNYCEKNQLKYEFHKDRIMYITLLGVDTDIDKFLQENEIEFVRF